MKHQEESPTTTTTRSVIVESNRSNNNPLFREDLFREKYHLWVDTVGEATLQDEGITEEKMRLACEIVCTRFPCGNQSGQLLPEPIGHDDANDDGIVVPLKERGVSMIWLLDVWHWIRNETEQLSPVLPTRLFVTLFIEPFVQMKQHQTKKKKKKNDNSDDDDDDDTTTIVPLYYFVPPEYRGKPTIFISHGWESWLRHLLFYPKESGPGMMLQTAQHRFCKDVYLWIDLFAIIQDPGSYKQKEEVSNIGDVVRSIGRTCLIVPGHGTPNNFALLPVRRSWCCFEIAFSDPNKLCARVGLHKQTMLSGGSTSNNNNRNKKEAEYYGTTTASSDNEAIDFHMKIITTLQSLTCQDATTRNANEKAAIDTILETELGIEKANSLIRQAVLHAFEQRYAGIMKYKPIAQRVTRLYRNARHSLATIAQEE